MLEVLEERPIFEVAQEDPGRLSGTCLISFLYLVERGVLVGGEDVVGPLGFLVSLSFRLGEDMFVVREALSELLIQGEELTKDKFAERRLYARIGGIFHYLLLSTSISNTSQGWSLSSI